MKEGQEILVTIKNEEFLITPNPFVKGTFELRTKSEDGGFDVAHIIESLDELLRLLD